MELRSRIPLSLFYLFNFAALGVFVPYFSLHARSLGFSDTRIGLLLALIPLAKATLPAVWGMAADGRGTRRLLLAGSSWAAFLAFAGFLQVETYTAALLVMGVYAALAVPALPFVEATTLEKLETSGAQYGRIRVFGSVGFVLSAALFGWWQQGASPSRVVPVHLVLLLATALAASSIRPEIRPRKPHPPGLGLSRPALLLLAAGFFMQASHGGYIGFFSIVLQESGYGSTAVGAAWSVAVTAEVLLLLVIGSIAPAAGGRWLMGISVAVAALRWSLYAFTLAPAAVAVGQVLHAFTYAGFHVAAVQTIHRIFPAGRRATGQALYSGWTFGAGMMVGTALSGWLKEQHGTHVLFGASALMALVALVLVMLGAGRHGDDPVRTATDPRSVRRHP